MMMQVYLAIAAMTAALAKEGIAKNHRNTQGAGFNFRGIDDIYAAIAPKLAEHKLCILPRVISREIAERTSKNGGALFYTTLMVEFDFVSAEDGSKHTVCMVGEAMDSGDKSANKAMSAAYKYACLQAFCIPTVGDNDADASTHEVANKDQEKLMVMRQALSEYLPSVQAIKEGIASGDLSTAAEAWFELSDEIKTALWVAPTKGGPFSIKEREVIKTREFREAFYGPTPAIAS